MSYSVLRQDSEQRMVDSYNGVDGFSGSDR